MRLLWISILIVFSLMIVACDQISNIGLSAGPSLKDVASNIENYENQNVTLTGKIIGFTNSCLSPYTERALQDSEGYVVPIKSSGSRFLTIGNTYTITGTITLRDFTVNWHRETCYVLVEAS